MFAYSFSISKYKNKSQQTRIYRITRRLKYETEIQLNWNIGKTKRIVNAGQNIYIKKYYWLALYYDLENL